MSRVKLHISSPDLPRPPWGCLGPPLSFIGISVLLGCSVISFSEKSFMDGWLFTSVPLQITLDQTPQPQCPMMVIWAKTLLLNMAKSLKHRTKVLQMEHKI